MKRDITVTISAVLLVLAMSAQKALDIPSEFSSESPLWQQLFFWAMFLAILRAMVLWFQTLIDAVRPKDSKEARVVWAVLHFVFGPLASYPYYYFHGPNRSTASVAAEEEELKRRANEGRL